MTLSKSHGVPDLAAAQSEKKNFLYIYIYISPFQILFYYGLLRDMNLVPCAV